MGYLDVMGTSAPPADQGNDASIELRRLAKEQAALRRVATLVASGAPSTEVFEALAREVAQVLQLPNAAVCRYDEAGETMTVVAVWGSRPHSFHPGSRWELDGPSVAREVLRTGRPIRVEDYADLPGALAAEARERGFDRVAGAPIIVDGRVWGMVATSSPDAPFPEHVEDRLSEFTDLVGIAIANSQAHDERAQLAEEQAALRRVATLVAARGVGPAEVFEAVSAEVAALIGADGSALIRYEPDGTITTVSGWTPEGGFSNLGVRYPLEGSVSGLILETGRPARVDRIADAQGEAQEAARALGFHSSVGAPLTVDGRLWGVLAVASKSEKPLPRDTEERLAEFAELFATAIANGEAHEQLEQLADQQAALRRVATLVAADAPTAEVFDAVTAEVAALIPADSSALTRYEADGTFTSLSGWALEGGHKYVGRRYPREGTVSGLIFETGRPGRVDNYAEAPGEASEVARELAWQSSVGAPVTVEGRPWGALVVVSKTEQPLPPETERRLTEFTELVATAIANSQTHEQLAQLADEQAALRRVATLVAAGAEPAEVFEAVSAEVAALMGADGSALTRYEDDGTVTALSGWTTEGGYNYVGRRYELEGTVSGLIFETGRGGRVENYGGAPGEAPQAAREMGWYSSVGAPLTVEGRLWGVLAVVSKSTQPLPRDTEHRLAQFAELFATAIANSEAHEQLAQLADEQAALRRVATLVAEGATPDRVFDGVRDEVARMFNADLSVLMRYDANGTATVLATSRGYLGPIGRSWPVGGDESAIARVCRTGLPARAEYSLTVQGPIAAAAQSEGARSAVGVPVVVEGTLWGVVAVGSRESEPLPADFEGRLAKFTDLLATAIANAEARAEVNASRARIVATADATRRRIERDLHDGAQQQLVWLALAVRAAQAAVPEELEQHRSELDVVVEGIAEVLNDLRETALGIHPAGLSEDGLTPALKRLVARSPLRVNLDVGTDGRFPEPVEVTAYYLVSEALTNAAKYADIAVVDVTVADESGTLRVEVRDAGRGGADPDEGSGLLGLRDRVEAIGGTMRLSSPPGAGTWLRVELPLGDRVARR
jgi:GAF domain-containing protein